MNRRITQLTMLFALLMAITLPTTASAQATTTTTSFSIPTGATAFVPCANGGAGEIIMLSGNRHIVTHVTLNGDHVIRKTLLNAQGISGTGLTTGVTYRAARVAQSTLTYRSDAEPFISSFMDTIMFIGQGSGDNFLLHHTSHLTFNGNGELITQHYNFFTDCK